MYYLFPSITVFFLTVFGCILAIKYFPLLGLLDKPRQYGLCRKSVPYPGGIVIYAVFMISLLLFFDLDGKFIGLITAATLLTFFNFIDDRVSISPFLRLAVQFAAVTIIIFAGIGILSITNPLGGVIVLDKYRAAFEIFGYHFVIPVFSAFFTYIWVIWITNAMNWLDGLNGSASGISTFAGIVLFLLSRSDMVNQPEIALLSLIIASISFGFLVFDFYPAKMLMGDTGSMFLGFLISVIAVFSGGKIATAFLIMGFPILDTVWVVLRRIQNRRSIFRGGYEHFHHRLLKIGFSHRLALLIIYFFCLVFGVSALFLRSFGKFMAIIIMFGVMLLIGRVMEDKRRIKIRGKKTEIQNKP